MHKATLEKLYKKYNRREFVHPDPLEFLYAYPDPLDREITAMVAACLAYGRVAQILRSLSIVLDKMVPSPRVFLDSTSENELRRIYDGFVHRFARADHLVALLVGIKGCINRYGSLHNCFMDGMPTGKDSVLDGLARFVQYLLAVTTSDPGHLLPDPARGSACKRLHLFLRWMVRKDAVDPGGWDGISPSLLIIPLDVHMFRIGHYLGFTRRKQANARAALDITQGFRSVNHRDPVKYDFSLTRLGIRAETDFFVELNHVFGLPQK
ncbi:MAG: TIGR02757 family protein [Desulfobacteraceae bacterium]|nr:TIGR02757 family protein [Desulfobacteraceae bacterium]